MHISIDNETNATQLYHLSILFQSLAKAGGFVAPVASTKVSEMTVELNIDTTDATTAIDKLAAHAAAKGVDVVEVPPVTVTVDLAQAESNAEVETERQSTDIAVTADTNLDINGLPWDARIHAGSRERNTDRSWRVRRRPKGVEEADWDATLARVTAELTDLMAIPVSPGAEVDAAAEEALTDAEVDAFVDIVTGFDPAVPGGDVTVESTIKVSDHVEVSVNVTPVAPPVTIAPPVVVPPVTAVAPPITVDKPAIETFAQLMSWLTSRTPKDEAAKPAMVTRVNEILAANGLTTLQQLGQRADLIPQVLVQFREAFGE